MLLQPGRVPLRTRGEKIRGRKSSAAAAPRPKYPRTLPQAAHMGRERETRTQRAEAISGRAAQRVQREHRQQTGGGEAPRPPCGDHQRPAPKYPREKVFTAGGPYKVPARAAHVIPRRLSTQANRTHAAPARKAALSSLPARRSAAADPPARKRGLFPFRPNRRGARTKQRNPRARAAALPAQARDPAPGP